jgi:hypothetical protein
MRAVAGVMLCLWLAVGWSAARADDTTPSLQPGDGAAIHDVIQGQLDAFRAGDAGRAFAYASPGIQGMFGDAAHFMAMVQAGYPPVYHPRSETFGALAVIDGRIVQKVRIIGPDGRQALALYSMEREPDGSWRIDGCQLTVEDEVGA